MASDYVGFADIATQAHSLMLASFAARSIIGRVVVRGRRATLAQRVSFGPASPAAPLTFDPAGHYFLYIGHQHPGHWIKKLALWIAKISDGHLAQPRELIQNYPWIVAW